MNVMNVLGKVLPDGTIIETLYDADNNKARFAVMYPDGKYEEQEKFEYKNERYVPLVDESIKREMLLLPTSYIDDSYAYELMEDIISLISRYVELEDIYYEVAARYILMSWVYDRFQRIPYLRIIGDFGTGKNRFLEVIRAMSYHSSFLGVAVTPANIFRWLDQHPGTLLIDEADYQSSDKRREIIQILNSGYERNGLVMRSKLTQNGYIQEIFSVFGPKVIAQRRPFDDDALESRFLTISSKQKTRSNLPRNLPPFNRWEEMIHIRNRLLGFRLECLSEIDTEIIIDGLDNYEPRLGEIVAPIIQVTEEDQLSENIQVFINQMREEFTALIGLSVEGQVVQAINELHQNNNNQPTIGELANCVNRIRNNQNPLNPRRVGAIVKGLGLYSTKTTRGYVVEITDEKLAVLRRRYGLENIQEISS